MEARNFIALKFDELKIKSKGNILSNSSLKSVCGKKQNYYYFAIFVLKIDLFSYNSSSHFTYATKSKEIYSAVPFFHVS